ncbi:hypothetical protein ROP_25910 [Rhodococcus opacus B4]|uniref:AB hydrolase-1 domain-containing protein n=1 Tax=Rhodococcus opacus (strain B4) TaxID=632772 RepID=C1B3Z0_RHOOB|nr:hypothetical protein ROP_25910 [Rhodococcus opacus B4]
MSVFFEAGMGKSRSTWSLVQPLVAEFAHTIVYDRAGHGLSDPDESGRDFDRILDDHLAVLDATVDRPCVVVGHSYGGPVVRVAANRRPDTIMAVALVDEVSEICKPERMMAAMRGASVLYGAQVVLARLKLLRPLLGKSYYRYLQGEALREAVEEGSTMNSVRAAWSEWRAFGESFTALHDSGPHIPEVSLTTISSNRIRSEKDRGRDFLGAAHRRTAELAPSGRHVYAEHRNHYIPLVEPHLVAREIRDLVGQVGAASGSGPR